MKLAHFGEDRLVATLTRGLKSGRDVRVGVGDDCAVIGKKTDPLWQLLKTDCVVEGIHFSPGEDARKIGWKALARTISDIAAMGGEPRHALVTMALSPETELARAKGLYAGLRRAARAFGVEIVGGETSRSPGPMFLSIALTGEVERARCITRGGGRPGDALYVTGRLGGSIRGKHLTFTPRLAEARWLTANFRLHAMMDLSDGLGADLPRLARASGTGFEIFLEKLPLNKGCTPQQGLADGEDYELLFAVAPRETAALENRWSRRFPNLRLTRIGALNRQRCANHPPSPVAPTGVSTINPPIGFDHFA